MRRDGEAPANSKCVVRGCEFAANRDSNYCVKHMVEVRAVSAEHQG